ncbi:protein-methionine-sulfoxide reductase heme-binding subunit MsrQ [Lacimonas salitolerans]|uniref:Protein-methionine-sulfoxide reductase heme-binding subunit MsrQ n=1 Tax=Lacimonas salitolerans TaxID=1323750 RepID=A0ABW4EKA1_9RHOB
MSLTDRVNAFARKLPSWVIYLIYAAPAPVFFYMAATGRMGAEPISALQREYGAIALQLLIIGLCITPLRRHLGVNLLKFRRAFGLLAFFYVVLHLGVWALLDVQSVERVWADIVKRPYITIGMVAFLLMIPLALTSNNRAVRWLGPRWRRLHRLTYGVVLLGAVHFIWLRKGVQIEPLAYLAVILAVLALRVDFKRLIGRWRAA